MPPQSTSSVNERGAGLPSGGGRSDATYWLSDKHNKRLANEEARIHVEVFYPLLSLTFSSLITRIHYQITSTSESEENYCHEGNSNTIPIEISVVLLAIPHLYANHTKT